MRQQSANKVIKSQTTAMKKIFLIFAFFLLLIFITGFCIPENLVIPVLRATENDWNKNTFWYEPWGKSGVHKGIDIFAPKGSKVVSATCGIVLYSGLFSSGGNVVIILGPKWRLHYYAHLHRHTINTFSLVKRGHDIGYVGDTGNAKGKPPHLHYSIVTLVPYPWRIDKSTQGWKKIFYLNPDKILRHRKVSSVMSRE